MPPPAAPLLASRVVRALTPRAPPLPPLLFLHGLLGSAGTYSSLLARPDCAPSSDKHALDLPGHGRSPHPSSPAGYALPALAAAVRAAAKDLPGPADVAGHSLGGKVAMALALAAPAAVRRLVVVDVAPVSYAAAAAGAMRVPRAAAAAMAALAGPLASGALPRRADVDAALEDAGVDDAGVRGFVCTNLVAADGGAWRWRCDAQGLVDAMDSLAGFELGEAAGTELVFEGPALFIVGGRSGYVTGDEQRAAARRRFPRARFEVLPHAGHWLQAEDPAGFCSLLTPFLEEDDI